MKKFLPILYILIIVSACSFIRPNYPIDHGNDLTITPSPFETETKTPTPTQVPASATPSPTTAEPSITPVTPTATTTPNIPIKPVLLSQGLGGGDGGIYFYDYIMYGGELPDIILYEDGQLLIREGNWYQESILSLQEACVFVRSVNNAISYAKASTRYNGTPTPEYGFFNGEPVVYIESVADNPIRHIYSIHEEELLSNDFLWPYSVVESISEKYETKPYKGNHLVLWIQIFDVKNSRGTSDIDHLDTWPFYNKPNLEKLITENSSPIIIVSGEEATHLMDELGNEPSITLYESRNINNKRFVVLSRPLLPHESAFDFLSGDGSYGWYHQYGDLNSICGQ